MSVTPEVPSPAKPSLRGAGGELILISIAVEPRSLESLLEALAELPFPVNPEIYHNADVTRVYPDGRQECELAVLVDFPAWEYNLEAVRQALRARGFAPESLSARNLLEGLAAESETLPAPQGSPYVAIVRRKCMASAA
ncbi:MAG: hypothetical protein ACUVXB_01710 [Bryobacteraceae bacterium]